MILIRQVSYPLIYQALLVLYLVMGIGSNSHADVVKPALIEIIINQHGIVRLEIRASIEAILTGINGRYKNTRDAPNAQAYDHLRHMNPRQLGRKFAHFQQKYARAIILQDDRGRKVSLSIAQIAIPERGYPKVPRISVITLRGHIPLDIQSVRFYYPLAFSDYAVRLKQVNTQQQQYHWSPWQWIRKDKFSEPMPLTGVIARKPWWQTVATYVRLGYLHILPNGMDHILFIVGLFLFAARLKPLLWQITMFTIAHTITLGLASYGLFDLPERLVQPLIALSIVYVGAENLWVKKLHKQRLVLVFGFGLLHGLGFARMLADFGMPDYAFFTALISFNLGVELGQLSILLITFLMLGLCFSQRQWYRQLVVLPASLLISLIAAWWFVDRLDIGLQIF